MTPHPVQGVVRVINDPDAGDNTAGETPREGTFEAALLWRLVKGEDVERWRVHLEDRYVFVPYTTRESSGGRPITVESAQARFPRAHRYLLPSMERFAARSFYRADLTPEFPWALSGPVEHLSATGALVFIRYLATGGRPAAAVVLPQADEKLDRTSLPYPNNKSNIYYTSSTSEAHFIAAFLNSGPAQEALSRFAVSTGVTPAALERLPLPGFDQSLDEHRRLAKLGEQAHETVENADQLAQVEDEIDGLVWEVAPQSALSDG